MKKGPAQEWVHHQHLEGYLWAVTVDEPDESGHVVDVLCKLYQNHDTVLCVNAVVHAAMKRNET